MLCDVRTWHFCFPSFLSAPLEMLPILSLFFWRQLHTIIYSHLPYNPPPFPPATSAPSSSPLRPFFFVGSPLKKCHATMAPLSFEFHHTQIFPSPRPSTFLTQRHRQSPPVHIITIFAPQFSTHNLHQST